MAGLSKGAQYLLELARLAPERTAGAAFIGPLFPYMPSQWSVLLSDRRLARALQRRAPFRWWGHLNAVHWREGYPEFADWFISRCLPESHSTKGIEDGVEWALDTDSKTLTVSLMDQLHTRSPAQTTKGSSLTYKSRAGKAGACSAVTGPVKAGAMSCAIA